MSWQFQWADRRQRGKGGVWIYTWQDFDAVANIAINAAINKVPTPESIEVWHHWHNPGGMSKKTLYTYFLDDMKQKNHDSNRERGIQGVWTTDKSKVFKWDVHQRSQRNQKAAIIPAMPARRPPPCPTTSTSCASGSDAWLQVPAAPSIAAVAPSPNGQQCEPTVAPAVDLAKLLGDARQLGKRGSQPRYDGASTSHAVNLDRSHTQHSLGSQPSERATTVSSNSVHTSAQPSEYQVIPSQVAVERSPSQVAVDASYASSDGYGKLEMTCAELKDLYERAILSRRTSSIQEDEYWSDVASDDVASEAASDYVVCD